MISAILATPRPARSRTGARPEPEGTEIHFREPGEGTTVTRVCLVGSEDCRIREELLSRETAREALATYRIDEPYGNTLAVETVSLGAAVALLNDLDWYLVRFSRTALVLEPSVSEAEWLSRDLATAVRNERVDPDETGEYLAIYGVAEGRLVEPLYSRRTGGVPDYDLRDVEETVVVRITEDEFEG